MDGKPIDVRFKHPKGVTMDDKENVYVADTANMAICKIAEVGQYIKILLIFYLEFSMESR
jgi:NHL repeat